MSDDDLTPHAPADDRQDYADFGDRIAGILTAAETAAAEIRADAERAADDLRRSARADADAYAADRRREAEEEAERLRAEAAHDAAAVRDAVYAAAQRIGDEGARTLEQLRSEARALEGRFESAVDNLRGLITQLENVVLDAGNHARAHDTRASEAAVGEPDVPVGAWDEPAPEDADRGSLDEDLAPRVARESHLS